jgi:hypothetical protein
MRIRDGNVTQGLSTDEAYERFFDGFYNLGRLGEIFERNVIVSRPKTEMPKAAVRRRIARQRRSIKRLAEIK